jgi:hypothetical protein
MTRMDVIYEIEPEYYFRDSKKGHEIKVKKEKEKYIKISDKLFDLMESEGLIRKTDDGYVFVGKYEDVLEFKKKKR